MKKERLITLTLVILAAAISRLLPHPENVSPIAAIALFGGAMFERKTLAFIVPALALFMSDMFIGFYEGMWVVYCAFALIVSMGFLLRGHTKTTNIIAATLTSSVLFFLVTNCAYLNGHGLYPANFDGLIMSYEAGIPFFRNTLLGDMFYSALLFGGFALAQRRFSVLRSHSLTPA